MKASGAITGELCYREASPKQRGGDRAYGEVRDGWGITTTTKYHFTGQREESIIELYFYNARWYDAALGRFIQADTVVPEPGKPQALNRYSYVRNNPLCHTDPRGPLLTALAGGVAGMVANLPMPQASTQIYAPSSQLPDIYGDPEPGPAPSNPADTVAQQSPNAIGHWGVQQVGQRLPVDVGQFRVAGGQWVYDGNMPTTDQYVEIRTTTRGVVNLDAHIRGQIAFDAAQQTRPLWIFGNGSPSQGLQVKLSKGGIPWQVLNIP